MLVFSKKVWDTVSKDDQAMMKKFFARSTG